tara:strand:+ start:284 stop:475 length:192 start_codon:yes stop_codon:yes gene_type:complete
MSREERIKNQEEQQRQLKELSKARQRIGGEVGQGLRYNSYEGQREEEVSKRMRTEILTGKIRL